jgi:hypothetical protein
VFRGKLSFFPDHGVAWTQMASEPGYLTGMFPLGNKKLDGLAICLVRTGEPCPKFSL